MAERSGRCGAAVTVTWVFDDVTNKPISIAIQHAGSRRQVRLTVAAETITIQPGETKTRLTPANERTQWSWEDVDRYGTGEITRVLRGPAWFVVQDG